MSVNGLNTQSRDERDNETPLSCADLLWILQRWCRIFVPKNGDISKPLDAVSRSCRGARASTALTTVKLAQPDWDPALPARGWLPKRHHGFHVIGANTSNFFPSGKSFLQFRVILNYIPSFGAGFDHSTTCCPLTTSTGTAGIVNLPFYSIFYFISFFQAVS